MSNESDLPHGCKVERSPDGATVRLITPYWLCLTIAQALKLSSDLRRAALPARRGAKR